ncbi:unnamed protein product, partial [Lampetra planeri]
MHHVKIKTERPDSEGAVARSRLDAVLKGLVEKSERSKMRVDTGKPSVDSINKLVAQGLIPSTRFPQHRRKKRKEMDEGIPESNQHKQNAYIIKLFDRSVDLAQFNTNTPLYPICRAWMRNNPSVREPAASPSPAHSMVEEEVGPERCISKMCSDSPPPTRCPSSTSGEPVNLRVPQTEKPCVSKSTDSIPVSGSFLCDHMERWKKIRQ